MKISYEKAVNFGFKKIIEKDKDQVFFKKYGFDYYRVEKKINKHIYLEWCCVENTVKFVYRSKKTRCSKTTQINDENFLKELINMFSLN